MALAKNGEMRAVTERLERVEKRLDSLEGRFDRLEGRVDALGADLAEVKATMATKADLERFATKTELERFATKADLERFATKAELEQVRDDISMLAKAQAAGFQQLSRQMGDFSKNWDMKWQVHGVAIRDHAKRIARLERRGAK